MPTVSYTRKTQTGGALGDIREGSPSFLAGITLTGRTWRATADASQVHVHVDGAALTQTETDELDAAHAAWSPDFTPPVLTDFRASRGVTSAAVPLDTVDYAGIGAPVITNPASGSLLKGKDKSRAIGIVTGKYRCDGTKCFLKIVESDLTNETDMSAVYEMPIQDGTWQFFQFTTNTAPSGGLKEYSVKGFRDPAGTATLADVDGVTLNLSELR